MVNRGALILKYSQQAVDWLNDADPNGILDLTVDMVNEERTVYLVSDHVCDSSGGLEGWVKRNCKALFERELYNWYMDESLWPQRRGWVLFQKWFTIEYHSVVEDLLMGDPIVDEDLIFE